MDEGPSACVIPSAMATLLRTATCTHLGNGRRREVLVVDVGLDLLDALVWNILLVVGEEALEELARVLEQRLPRVPVVIHFLPGLLRQGQRVSASCTPLGGNAFVFCLSLGPAALRFTL